MPQNQSKTNSQTFLISLIPIFFWSSNYVVMKWATVDMSMSLFTCLRFAALIPLLFVFKKPNVSLLKISILSAVWLALNLYCMGRALECGIDTGYLALGYVSSTIFVVILSYLVNRETVTQLQMIGIGLAFTGIGIIAYVKGLDPTHLSGVGYLLLSNFFIASGVILLKKFDIPSNLPTISWISALAAFPLLALSIFDSGVEGLISQTLNLSSSTIYSILYASICASFIGGLIWIDVINKLGANISSFISFLVPLFGLAFGAIFFDEALTPEKIIASALILSGVFLCVKKKLEPTVKVHESCP